MNEKVWKINCLWILVSSLTMTSIANAACTPTPDCTSIGYTETNCEGASLKCPFDITKMKCMPCDSLFRYECSEVNMTGGAGNACGGKYVSCTCSDTEYTFKNGKCIAPKCPAGYIYYSDKSCSDDLDTSKTAIGIVVKGDKYITALNVPRMAWTSELVNVDGITDFSSSTARNDYAGKANTLAILETFPSGTTSNNAAVFCNSYTTEGTNAGDWYLPAFGELYNYIYTNYAKVKAGWDKVGTSLTGDWFWSSSEAYTNDAWNMNLSTGGVTHIYKANAHSVACILAL